MNFDITYQLILPALQKIAELTHSYGWAIILLTIAFRALVSPLVAQTTISMRRMSKLQPQMKVIQERYKGDPEQLQKKLMEFYAKNKVNPLGGCLPTLVQLPILFALYAAFAGPPFTDKTIDVKVNVLSRDKVQALTKDEASGANSIYVSKNGVPAKVVMFPGNATVMAGSDLNFGVRAVDGKLPATFSPKWKLVLPSHEVKEALATPEETIVKKIKDKENSESREKNKTTEVKPQEAYIDKTGHAFFPVAGEYHVNAVIPGIAKEEPFAFISGLGKIATGAMLLKPSNYDVVFLIMMFGLTMFLSQKLTVPPPKPADGKELDEQQIIQQQTMKTMPIVTTAMFFFFPIPAGVYLYLVVSNIIQTFQTWLIARMPEPDFSDSEDSEIIVKDAKIDGGSKSVKKTNKSLTNINDKRSSSAATGVISNQTVKKINGKNKRKK